MMGVCEWINQGEYFESRMMIKYKRGDFAYEGSSSR